MVSVTSDVLRAHARSWSSVACDVLETPYPYDAGHQSLDRWDVDSTPHVLHPAFHGCFDWHSSVHMQWSLVRLLTLVPGAVDPRVLPILNRRLTPEAIEVEVAYLRARPTYERPYGWAWLVALMHATRLCPVPEATAWSQALRPLFHEVGGLTSDWLGRQALPARHGLQGNSAFAMAVFMESFDGLGHQDLTRAIRSKALSWYSGDEDMDTRFEPSGTDVFSPSLTEAELMRRVLPANQFRDWLAAFLPGLGTDRHLHLLDVPAIQDDGDGPLTHLSGLALSRAWQLRSLASTQPPGQPSGELMRAGAARQAEAVLPRVTGGTFMSTHWLISFAILAELGGFTTPDRRPDRPPGRAAS